MKKSLSLILCIAVMLCMFPFSTFADDLRGAYVGISADVEIPVEKNSNVKLTATLYNGDPVANYEYEWLVDKDGSYETVDYQPYAQTYQIKKITKTTKYKVVVRLDGELVSYDVITVKIKDDTQKEVKVILSSDVDTEEVLNEGTAVTLQADCDATDAGALSYRWYVKGLYASNSSYTRISGAGSDTYRTTATDACYKVEVASAKKTLGSATLEISTWKNLNSEYRYHYVKCSDYICFGTEGAEISYNASNDVMKDIVVQKKVDGTYKSDVSEALKESLSFRWTSNDGSLTGGASSSTIKIKPHTSSTYTAEVSYMGALILEESYTAVKSEDDYALDGFSISSTNMIDGESYVSSGASLTLNVTAPSLDGCSFQWVDADDQLISGANSASYATGAITQNSRYGCIVEKQDYSTCLYFDINVFDGSVSVNNALTVVRPGDKTYLLEVDGDKVVIHVCEEGDLAFCITGSGNGTFTSKSSFDNKATLSFDSKANKKYFINLISYDNSPNATLTVSPCEHKNTELLNVKAATTSATGYTGDTYCYDCRKQIASGFKTEHVHTLVAHPAVSPTCVSNGNVAYWTCSGTSDGQACNVVFKDAGQKARYASNETWVINKTGVHTPGSYVVEKEATCTAEGSESCYCTVCKARLNTRSIAKKSHNQNKVIVTVAPTCATTGTREYRCSACNLLIKTETIAATGQHNCVNVNHKDSTCRYTGYSGDMVCTVCKATINQGSVIPKLKHNLVKVKKKNPTCCKYGYKAHYECKNCGRCFTDAEGKNKVKLSELRINKVSHSYTKKSVDKRYLKTRATKKSAAVYRYSCKWCGKAGKQTFKYGKKIK